MTKDDGGRFVSPEPPPTAREREVVEIIAEEAAEVIQRATKLLRFGVKEVQPGQDWSNAERLGQEIGDFIKIVDVAIAEGIIPEAAITDGINRKEGQLARYMQTDAMLAERSKSDDD